MNLSEIQNQDSLTDEEVNTILLHQQDLNKDSGHLEKHHLEKHHLEKHHLEKHHLEKHHLERNHSLTRKADAYHFLGLCSLEKNELSEAKIFLSHAISLSPKTALFYNSLANLYLTKGDTETSGKYYQEAILFNESFTDAWNHLASLNFSQGHYQDALKNYQISIEINPNQTDAWYRAGLIWELAGNYREAETCYKNANHLDHVYDEIELNLANVIQKQNRSQEAILIYNRCINRNPDNVMALFNSGTAYLSLGDFEKALALFEMVLKQNPCYFVDVHRNIGLAFHLESHHFQAIKEFQLILTKHPDLADIHLYLGEVYYELRDYKGAIREFKTAIEINPEYAQAYHSLANSLKRRGNVTEAFENYQLAIQINPESAQVYYDMASLMKEEGEHIDSIIMFRESVRLSSNFLQARIEYGLVYLELGRIEEAIEQLELVLEQQSDHEEASQHLSPIYLKKELFTRGWEYFSVPKEPSRLPTKHDKLPYWQGEPLSQHTIYINDIDLPEYQILYSTCLPDIIESSEKCYIEVRKDWISIYQRAFPDACVISLQDRSQLDYNLIDYQIDISNLPRYFRNEASDFPVQWRIFEADPQLTRKYCSRLEQSGKGIKIGLSLLEEGSTRLKDQGKWIQNWQTLLEEHDANFVDLHRGKNQVEFKQICEDHPLEITTLSEDQFPSPEDYLAQIASCDLILSADNLTAHYAGSLGIPVWLILPYQTSWYWFLNRESSLWYNNVRIFRQSRLEQWDGVFAQINRHLERTLTIWTE